MSEQGDDDRHRGSFRALSSVIAVVIAVGTLIWVWSTSWGTNADFPTTLLQAEGVVLTAAVFVLALSQNNFRRDVEGILAEAKDGQEVLTEAYLERKNLVTSMRLWDRAVADNLTVFYRPRSGNAKEAARLLKLTETAGGSLGSAWALFSIQNELDREEGSDDAPSVKRRRYLERERDRINREIEATAKAFEKLNLDESGMPHLMGRFLVSELSVRRLLRLINVFFAVMGFLVIAGAAYAGWQLTWVPAPELWAALTYPALGGAYTALVSIDIRAESARFVRSVQRSWFVIMNEAEQALGESVESRGKDSQRIWRRRAFQRLRVAEQICPGMPWQASFRGRLTLLEAIETAERVRIRVKVHGPDIGPVGAMYKKALRYQIGEADRLLRIATARADDPIAALAHARLLRLKAEEMTEVRDQGDRAKADDLVNAALDLVESAAFELEEQFTGQPTWVKMSHRVCRMWIRKQAYLWPPTDSAAAARLEQLI